jgi:predicted nuclease of predicted toxin-antitoxin system
MRFVVDAQLPPALARWLAARGHEAQHVNEIGLSDSSDADIWEHARSTGAVLVTKDQDFLHLSQIAPGPLLVWVTMGNTGRKVLLDRFETALPEMLEALTATEKVVELR